MGQDECGEPERLQNILKSLMIQEANHLDHRGLVKRGETRQDIDLRGDFVVF